MILSTTYLMNHKKKTCMNFKDIKLSGLIKKPIKISPNMTLGKIRGTLLEKNVKHAIIVDKEKAIGVVTEKDIAKKIYELDSKSIESVKAKTFKSKKLFTLTKNDSVQQCAKIMKRHRISLVIILKENKNAGGHSNKNRSSYCFSYKRIINNQGLRNHGREIDNCHSK